VRERGVEPLSLAALDPKSSASASSATLAVNFVNINKPRDDGAHFKWGG
jgi:hypothetical protein